MSFARDVKAELCQEIPLITQERLAVLAGFISACGTIKIRGFSQYSLAFTGENPTVIRYLFSIIKAQYGYVGEIYVEKDYQLQRRNLYRLLIEDLHITKEILFDTHMIADGYVVTGSNLRMEEALLASEDQTYAFLKGFFLGSGTVLHPQKYYLLEFLASMEYQADLLTRLLENMSYVVHRAKRGNYYVVAIRDGNGLSELLTGLGAYQALFVLENVRIQKDINNQVNRLVNCETANVSRIANQSIEQRQVIEQLKQMSLWNDIDETTKKLANLRIQYPYDSLTALGERMDPPLTKSAVHYRLNKLKNYKKELERDKS